MRLMMTPAGSGLSLLRGPGQHNQGGGQQHGGNRARCRTGFSRRNRQASSAAPAGISAMAAMMPVVTLAGWTVPASLAEMKPVQAMIVLNRKVPSAPVAFSTMTKTPARIPSCPGASFLRAGQIHGVAEHGIEPEHDAAGGEPLEAADICNHGEGCPAGTRNQARIAIASINAAAIRPLRRPILRGDPHPDRLRGHHRQGLHQEDRAEAEIGRMEHVAGEIGDRRAMQREAGKQHDLEADQRAEGAVGGDCAPGLGQGEMCAALHFIGFSLAVDQQECGDAAQCHECRPPAKRARRARSDRCRSLPAGRYRGGRRHGADRRADDA